MVWDGCTIAMWLQASLSMTGSPTHQRDHQDATAGSNAGQGPLPPAVLAQAMSRESSMAAVLPGLRGAWIAIQA